MMANTRRVWEPRYGHALSDDEITDMLVGVGRLFDVLTNTDADEAVDASTAVEQSADSA